MLLTRSPLSYSLAGVTAFDLHVLGTPPALILSQDQTLMLKASLTLASETTLNARPIGSALFNPSVICGRRQLLKPGLTTSAADSATPHADSFVQNN